MELASFVQRLKTSADSLPEQEDKDLINQHLLPKEAEPISTNDFDRGRVISDPAVRAEFERVLQFEDKQENGPIINASLDQDALILKLLERQNERHIHLFYNEKYDLQPEITPNILSNSVGEFYPQEMIELTEYCRRLDIDQATGQLLKPHVLTQADILK